MSKTIDLCGRSVGLEDLNLDALSADELLELVRQANNNTGGTTEALFGENTAVNRGALEWLVKYALAKTLAIGLRKNGDIANAMMRENECERIYNKMPKIVRW